MLRDSYSLRVSILENCQYRCGYCLPGTVKPFAHKPTWLTPTHYETLAFALAHLPISKVRFTGGEPLLRKDLCEIVATFRRAMPEATLTLTTNAQHLEMKALQLKEAGISRLNVHVDSLKPDVYKKAMGDGDVDAVLDALPKLREHFTELKINVVLQKGINDDELCNFIEFSHRTRIEVRFIELMNTGSAKSFVREHFLSGADAIAILAERYSFNKIQRRHASDPAQLFTVAQTGVTFGLIASDTQPFCADCDRLRLTASGELRGCLYQPSGVDLASLIKAGVSGEEVRKAIDRAVFGKRSFHPLVSGSAHSFSMAEIGG